MRQRILGIWFKSRQVSPLTVPTSAEKCSTACVRIAAFPIGRGIAQRSAKTPQLYRRSLPHTNRSTIFPTPTSTQTRGNALDPAKTLITNNSTSNGVKIKYRHHFGRKTTFRKLPAPRCANFDVIFSPFGGDFRRLACLRLRRGNSPATAGGEDFGKAATKRRPGRRV